MNSYWLAIASSAVIATVITKIFDFFVNLEGRKHRRQETLNEMVFMLLEIRYLVRTLKETDFTPWIDEYLKVVKEKIGNIDFPKEFQVQLTLMLKVQIEKMAVIHIRDNFSKVREKYFPLAQELAKFHPILAFRLNGRQDVMSLFDTLDNYYKEMDKHIEPTLESSEVSVIEKMNKIFAKDFGISIEKDILETAYASSIGLWFKTKKILRSSFGKVSQDKEKIEEFVEQIVQVARENGHLPTNASLSS